MTTPGRTSPKKFQQNANAIITALPPTTKGRAGVDPLTVRQEVQQYKQKFRLDTPSKIKPILKTLIEWHTAIVRYRKVFATLPKGAKIRFEVIYASTGKTVEITYTIEHVKAADELFKKGINNIEWYLRAKGTKVVLPGAPVERKPNALSQAPCYVPDGSPLLAWIHAEDFGAVMNGNQQMSVHQYVMSRHFEEAEAKGQGSNYYRLFFNVPGQGNGVPLYQSGLFLKQTIDDLFLLAVSQGGSNRGLGLRPAEKQPVRQNDGEIKMKGGGSYFDVSKSRAFQSLFASSAQFKSEYDPVKKLWVNVPLFKTVTNQETGLLENVPLNKDKTPSVSQVVHYRVAATRAMKVKQAENQLRTPPVENPWNVNGSIFYGSHLKVLVSVTIATKSFLGLDEARRWPLINSETEFSPSQALVAFKELLETELQATSTVRKSRGIDRKETAAAAIRATKISKPLGL